MKPKIFEEVDEEMAKDKYLEENVKYAVRCPVCNAVLKLAVPTIEDAEEEEEEEAD